MSSKSETGHAKIPANLYTLNSIGTRNSAVYKPANAKIKTTAIDALITDAETKVKAVAPAAKAYNDAIDARQLLFSKLNATAAAACNNLASADGVTPASLKAVNALLKKINGTAAKKSKTAVVETTTTAGAATASPEKAHSKSQQSFDMRTENFNKLLAALALIPQYEPEEAELKLTALTAYAAQLTAANKNVDTDYSPYATALKQRDTLLYHPETGITVLAGKIKNYIKSVNAISAADKKEAAALQFKCPAKKNLFL